MSITTLIAEGEPRTRDVLQAFCTDAGPMLLPPTPSRILVGERAHRFHFLETSSVDYLEVDGNYVTIHVGEECFLMRATLKQLSAELSACDFLRIDRSCLVNLRRVEYVERLEGGQFAFALRDGQRVVSSRERASEVLRLLRNPIR